MTLYDQLVDRAGGAAELPEDIAGEIITGAARSSKVLALGRVIKTATRDSRIPVVTETPEAFWVGGDVGLKATGKAVFTHQAITAEELAVIVPVPDAILADSDLPLWSQIKPQIIRALGRRLAAAVLFGQSKPASWTSPSLFDDAVAAGNTVTETADPVADILHAAEKVSEDLYPPSGAVVRSGWQYGAGAVRSLALVANPVGADQPFPLRIGGLGVAVDPLFWDRTKASALVVDWENIVIGIRQDVTLEIFNSGVITDETGAIKINLLQQDVSAIRAVFRVGFLLAHPIIDNSLTTGSPVAAVVPASG